MRPASSVARLLGDWGLVKRGIYSPLNSRTPRIFHALSMMAVGVIATIAAQVIVVLVEEASGLRCKLAANGTTRANMTDATERRQVKPSEVESEDGVCPVAVLPEVTNKHEQEQCKEGQC